MPAIIGVDVGGTFTDVALDARAAAGAGQGLDHGARSVGGCARGRSRWRSERAGLRATRGRAPRPRHHGRHQRAAGAARRAHGAGDHPRLRRPAASSPARPGPHLYRLDRRAARRRWPTVTAEVDERMGPDGVITAARPGSVDAAARRLRRAGVEAVAVCLLHSYAHAGARARGRRPAARAARRRARGRVDRAGARDARVRARLDHGRRRLPRPGGARATSTGWARRAARRGLPAAAGDAVERRAGRARRRRADARRAAAALRAGRRACAAVVAGGARRRASASTWAAPPPTSCLIRGGAAERTAAAAGGRAARCGCRMLDIHTVGAGGGSIAWIDEGGALRVGPRSAGRRSRARPVTAAAARCRP